MFVEPKTMCCYDITEVVMSGGHNIFKGTGSLDKYVWSFIADEVKKGFSTSSNSQGVFEILDTFLKSAAVHLIRLQRNPKLHKWYF